MGEIVIRAEKLGKCFRIGRPRPRYRSLRDSLAEVWSASARRLGSRLARQPGERREQLLIWALRDISFEIRRGEVIGVVGHNGAGKSTLLKVLSRITEPTVGSAEISGRVGSLLEIGTGFHPELSGRENIYLSGAIQGMRRSEIERGFDEIVAFAEVEPFLDTPVKHYSSGMYLRLAFAVAAHLRPHVLLVDEVLAVGDIGFQKRCLGKMGAAANEGRTILFVSHNLAAIENLCSRTMLLRKGVIDVFDVTSVAIARYLSQSTDQTLADGYVNLNSRRERDGTGRVRFQDITLRDAAGEPSSLFRTGEEVFFDLRLAGDGDLSRQAELRIAIKLYDPSGVLLVTLSNEFVGPCIPLADADDTVRCRVNELPLVPGSYSATLACYASGILTDLVTQAFSFHVVPGDFYRSGKVPKRHVHGALVMRHEWIANPLAAPGQRVSISRALPAHSELAEGRR
jgi:lipopolysaccharide transport system ATP-binding protein